MLKFIFYILLVLQKSFLQNNYKKHTMYTDKIYEILLEEFKNKVCDFRRNWIQFKLFSDHFSMSIIKHQRSINLNWLSCKVRGRPEVLKTFYRKNTLLLFYKKLHSQKIILIKFLYYQESYYKCGKIRDQFFSSMKNIKTAEMNRLTDKYLKTF